MRYPNKSSKSGYAYATFATRKEALAFRDNSKQAASRLVAQHHIVRVEQGVQLWLDICEKKGLNGREPVTKYTLANYRYYAGIYGSYSWPDELQRLKRSDIVSFRSWLLQNYSRAVAHKSLAYFHSMILELVSREVIATDIAAGVRALPEKTESGGIPLRGRIGFKIPTGREASMGWGSHIRRICVYA